MIRIIIRVEGDCIQEIKADSENLNISILDEDELEFGSHRLLLVYGETQSAQALRKEFDNLPYSGF